MQTLSKSVSALKAIGYEEELHILETEYQPPVFQAPEGCYVKTVGVFRRCFYGHRSMLHHIRCMYILKM